MAGLLGMKGKITMKQLQKELRDVFNPNEKVDMAFTFSKRFNCLYR